MKNQGGISFSETFVSTSTLLGILGIVFCIFVLVSIILYYHWRTYTEKGKLVVIVELVYLTGGALLFSSALVLIGLI